MSESQDAARYRFLRDRLLAADFDWNESGECVLVFRWPSTARVSADCDATVDEAMSTAGVTVARHQGPGPKDADG
jgi:hypothetical protein